ncbi:putative KEX1 protein [Rhodotorula sp. JG-1b]|nr:putative KEX1 protein [Rhodotorula sp. JG-1b]
MDTAGGSTYTWDTRALVERNESASAPRTALILLNSPLPPQPLFAKLWKTATLRFCADGGANRLYDRFVGGRDRSSLHDDVNEEDWLPDLVLGDLDSLRQDVRAYYEQKGVTVEQDPDEYSTDLGKNVARLTAIETGSIPPPHNPKSAPRTIPTGRQQFQIVLIGGLSGRLDQTIHTLHAMTLLAEKEQRDRVWAIGKESAALLLTEGSHQLHVDLALFGKTCGILPVGVSEAHVTTKGLEWNLGPNDYMYPTSLSSAVSTSNHLIQEDIKIETDVPVVWTMEVRGGAE